MIKKIIIFLPAVFKKVEITKNASRTQRFQLSVFTSVGSKITAIALQLLSFPIAVKVIGAEKFGVFATLTATLAWMSMASLGLGPGLTKGIALAAAKGDRTDEARYFSSALFLFVGIGLILSFFLTLSLWLFPVETIFGTKYKQYTGEIQEGLFVLGIFVILQLILSVIDSTQAGYQEQYINNIWNTTGNVISAVLLGIGVYHMPTITGLIIAIYGGAILSKILNGYYLVKFSRSYLSPQFKYLDFHLIKLLFSTGVAFLVIQLCSFFHQQFGTLIQGYFLGPKSVASFAIMLRLSTLCGGIITTFTQPLFPALMDAVSHRDIHWIRKAYRKMLFFSMLYSVIIGLIFALAGQKIILVWIGAEVMPSTVLQVFMGLYFVLVVWSHVHYTVLIGMGQLWIPAWVLLLESLFTIPLSIYLIKVIGNAGVPAAFCIAMSCLSTWLFPAITQKEIKNIVAGSQI